MKKRTLIIGLILALILVIIIPMSLAWAATNTGTVTCTVIPMIVSVSVSNGAVNYGPVGLSQTKDTLNLDINNVPTVTNNGTVAVDFKILSSDATRSGGTTWSLASSTGPDQFTHKFCIDTQNRGSSWAALTTSYQNLTTNIAANDVRQFDLQIGMPSSTADSGAHNITITIQAISHS